VIARTIAVKRSERAGPVVLLWKRHESKLRLLAGLVHVRSRARSVR